MTVPAPSAQSETLGPVAAPVGVLVRRALVEAGAGPAVRVSPLRSTNNSVHRARTELGEFVVKHSERPGAFEYELDVLRFLDGRGLPHPQLVGWGVEDGPIARTWMVMRFGGPSLSSLTRPAADELLPDAGRLAADYHAVRFERFDKLGDTPGGGTDSDEVGLPTTELEPTWRFLRDDGWLTTRQTRQVEQVLGTFLPTGDAVLCHGELTLAHFLVADGSVACAVDWPAARAYTAAWDLAMTEAHLMAVDRDFGAFLGGYAPDGVDGYEEVRRPYIMSHALQRLGSNRVSRPQFGPLLDVLRSVLDAAPSR